MKLNEMQSFLAVAEAGSVQDAGRRLGLTQSAVSRLVQRLEAEIGAELFDRSSKPFRLTRAGETALVHCRRVLRAIDDFSSEFSADAAPSGPFRLGLTPAMSSFAARAPVEHARRLFPDLSIRLSNDWTPRLLEQVRKGDLDAAVIVQGPDQALMVDLEVRRLQHERVHIIAPASLGSRSTETLEQMNEIGWALLPSGCHYRSAIRRALERSGQPMNIVVEAFDQELLVLLVARGTALGVVPLSMLVETPFADQVRIVDCPDFRLDVSFWFVRGRHPERMSPVMDAVEARIVDILTTKHSITS
jgi:DNA-binding transcriptional LysR family regulator